MDLPPLSELAPRLLAMGGLLVCSAFFSGSEVALFSLSRGQRERLSRSEKAGERYVASLLAEPKRLIATLLLGNELVNITFSSLVAGLIGQVLAGWDTLAIVITSTAVTVPLLLVFGEITPKSIAIAVSEGWAKAAARPLGLLMLLVTPVRLVVTTIAGLVVRLLGQDPNPKPKKLDEAQFRALIEAGSEAGEVGAAEQKLIHNVFAFGDRNVAEVMTPAKQVYSLSYELPVGRVVGEVAKSGYSRVPIHRGRRHEAHEIVGVLFAKDLVGWPSGRLAQKTLKDLLRPVTFVPRSAKLTQVFQEFRKNRTHFAVVVDE